MSSGQAKATAGQGRRGFLKLAGLGAAASSVATVAGSGAAQVAEAAPATGSGYRLTTHVRKVYELARF